MKLKDYLYYEDDWAAIYCGDCLEIFPFLSENIQCIVTDPLYGMGFDVSKPRTGRRRGLNWAAGNSSDKNRNWEPFPDDKKPFDPKPFLHFKEIILWGGNNYSGLPTSRGWLIWDKRKDTKSDDHGDAELAWTNINMPIRIHRQIWRGIVREGDENLSRMPKLHPFQKPLALMMWCVSFTKLNPVLDPFMGSGTTLLACKKLNRQSVGIEINPRYCEIAVKRLRQEVFDFTGQRRTT